MNTTTKTPKQIRTEAATARAHAAHDALVSELRDRGAIVGEYPDALVVNGTRLGVRFVLESSGGRYSPSPNGKVRAIVGDYGDTRQFPEGKNGVHIQNVADAVLSMTAGKRAEAERRAALAAVVDTTAVVASRVNGAFGVREYDSSPARAYVTSTGRLAVKADVAGVTEDQATAILAAIRAIVGAGK